MSNSFVYLHYGLSLMVLNVYLVVRLLFVNESFLHNVLVVLTVFFVMSEQMNRTHVLEQ